MKNQNQRTVLKLLCVALPLAAVAVGIPHILHRHKLRKYSMQ